MNLQDLKNTISRLRATTPEVMRKETLRILRSEEQLAISMNTDQLFAGQLANGQPLPDYSETSILRFNKRPGPWTLYEDGDFYKGFFMKADKFPVMFGSKDSKTDLIRAKVEAHNLNSDDIFGVNKQNLTELARIHTLPKLQNFVRSIIRIR